MIWLSSIRHRVKNSLDGRPDRPEMKQDLIGILAFETAKTLSRLISIHKSLSDAEITKLRRDIMGSEGVRYLNSVDEGYLLRLACTEKIVDLDRVSLAVARLGKKCQEPGLHGFEHVYADMKLGLLDFGRLGFSPKEVGGKIAKMDKLVSATAELHTGLEVLAEMEVSERRLQSWKSFSGPIQVQAQKPNSELFEKKLAWQRSHVRRIRHTSLWNKSFDQIVSLMARAVCTVFARICYVFGPYVSDLPQVLAGGNVLMKPQHLRTLPRLAPRIHASGPLDRFPIPSDVFSKTPRPFSPKRRTGAAKLVFDFGFGFTPEAKKEGLFLDTAGPAPTRLAPASSTVGAASLAVRYANVIISAETLLTDPESMDAESREDMYQMLPARLRSMVREKMKRRCKKTGESDESLAEGWREGVGRIVGWLAPMAHDTIRWQMERNMERQEFESRPMVLLLQTLYYADKEKAEAAITEVLVGLSCMYHYGNRSDSSQKV